MHGIGAVCCWHYNFLQQRVRLGFDRIFYHSARFVESCCPFL
jgi:hypothetical protein